MKMRTKLTKREYKLIRDGYFYTGTQYYYKDEAKEEAKELRAKGKRAVVVSWTPRHCTTQYVVYSKDADEKVFKNWDDERLEKLHDEHGYIKPMVTMGVTYSPYTDEYPYEIIEVINDKRIKVRELDSKATKEYGVFTGDMALYSNEDNKVVELKKLKYGWKRNSKDTGSWYIGKAERYEDPHF